jgi:uncharacterized protein YbjQ (UPF0145 family)
MDILTIVAFFIFLFWMAYRFKVGKARKIIERASAEIMEFSREVLMVSSSEIPGREIKQVIGHVSGGSRIEASCPEETEAAALEAKLSLLRNAYNMGGNAIIDARLTSCSYQAQGSEWMVTKSSYTGTAVVI